MNDFRDCLEAELDAEPQRPVADLVAGAVLQGRRIIRFRRLTVTAAFAFVALTVGAASWLIPRHLVPTTPPADAGRVYVPADAAAIAAALTSRLPSGVELVAAYKYEKDPAAVAVYLDRGHGQGLMQFAIDNYPRTAETCEPVSGRNVRCYPDPDGSLTVVATTPERCQEKTVVQRFRVDGVHISLYLADCLMGENGTANPPAPAALSVDEAIELAEDPIWATRMDARQVADGATRFPSLPVWVDE